MAERSLAAARARVDAAGNAATQERLRMRALYSEAKGTKQREFDIKKTQAEGTIQDARGERSKVREQVANAYAAQAESNRHARVFEEEIWETQQKRVVDNLIFKKLRLEKLQAKRTRLLERVQDKEGQLGSLAVELSRRDLQSGALLQDSLQHADALQEALLDARRDGSDLKQMWLRQNNQICPTSSSPEACADEQTTREFSMVDELMAHRLQNLRKESRANADVLRSLHKERRELSEKRYETTQRRREVAQLMAKGKDLLAEIELGAAPPTAFIRRNLVSLDSGQQEEAAVRGATLTPINLYAHTHTQYQSEGWHLVRKPNEDDDAESLDVVVQRLQHAAVESSVNLEALRRESSCGCAPEKLPGSLEHDSEPCGIVRLLLQEVLDVVWEQCFVCLLAPKVMEVKKRWWEAQGDSLRKDINRRKLADVAWALLTSLTDEVVAEFLQKLHNETYELKIAASMLGAGIVLDCVQSICSSKRGTDCVRKHIYSSTHRNHRNHHHGTAVTWFSAPVETSAPRPRRPVLHTCNAAMCQLNHLKQSVARGDTIAPSRLTARRSSIHSAALNVDLRGRVGISSVKLSPNGQLLCAGRLNGQVSVWCIAGQQEAAVAVVRESAGPDAAIVEIGWSVDSSQVYTINTLGIAYLWSIQPATQGYVSENVAKELALSSMLDAAAVTGLGTDISGQNMQLMPRTGSFHPGMTVLGTQHSLVVGLHNGDVLKCTNRPQAAERTINLIDLSKVCGADLAHATGIDGAAKISTFRRMEVFSAHKDPIVFTGFAGNHMVTLDTKGKIRSWAYLSDTFTGFQWFHPEMKGCDLHLQYTCAPKVKPGNGVLPLQKCSPGELVPEPPNPLLDPVYLQQVHLSTHSIANLSDLRPEPCASGAACSGTTVFTYPRQFEGGSTFDRDVNCTVLEYGVAGAGAGLLIRHAQQMYRANSVTRGAPTSNSHVSFTPSLQELYMLLSSEEQGERPSLAIVGIHVTTMAWLPLRINVGLAAETTPALSVCNIGNRRQELGACVLNGTSVRMYSLCNGSVLYEVKCAEGTWDCMDFNGVKSTMVVASGERSTIQLWKIYC